MQESLTLDEAISQGYKYALCPQDGWQLIDLEELKSGRGFILESKHLELAEKEPLNPGGLSSNDIAELLAEHLECNHSADTGDDTMQVYNSIKELDFSDAEAKIADALGKIHCYTSSVIKLSL